MLRHAEGHQSCSEPFRVLFPPHSALPKLYRTREHTGTHTLPKSLEKIPFNLPDNHPLINDQEGLLLVLQYLKRCPGWYFLSSLRRANWMNIRKNLRLISNQDVSSVLQPFVEFKYIHTTEKIDF